MSKTVLMCAPKYFDIEYEINVWMHHDDQPTDETATQQWQKLYDIYTQKMGWHVELIEPAEIQSSATLYADTSGNLTHQPVPAETTAGRLT